MTVAVLKSPRGYLASFEADQGPDWEEGDGTVVIVTDDYAPRVDQAIDLLNDKIRNVFAAALAEVASYGREVPSKAR